MREYTKITSLALGVLTCLFITEKVFGDESIDSEDKYGYTLCEGSGEKCVVALNGVGNPFGRKGKDKSAIVIKL